jgi:hypothetical protein
MSSLRAMRDAENSRRRAQIRAEDDAESSSKVRENIRPRRHCVLQPSIVPLTEETLLQLEQSHPRYRLTQRNLNHWFYYLESTLQDTFNTFAGIPDKTYKPGSSAGNNGSILSLANADFQESHVSPPSSADIFGLTVCEPLPEVEAIIPDSRTSANRTSSSSSSDSSSSSSWNPLPPTEESTAQSTAIQPQTVEEASAIASSLDQRPRTYEEFWETHSRARTHSFRQRPQNPRSVLSHIILLSDSE